MMNIGTGVVSGVAASEVISSIHNDPMKRDHIDILEEMNLTLCALHTYLRNTLSNKPSYHQITNTFISKYVTIEYNDYLGIYVLVPIPCTFNISVSGLATFVWTPSVGSYNRWKFESGTEIQLVSPVTSSGIFPIDILYTDDLT